MDKKKICRLLKSTYTVALISKLAVVILGLVSSALLNRLLGPELKGEYSYHINLVTIFTYVLSCGVGQTYAFYRKKIGQEIQDLYIDLSYIHAGLVLVVAAGVLPISLVYSLTILICSISVWRSNLGSIAAVEDVKKRDILHLVAKALYLIVVSAAYFINKRTLVIALLTYFTEEIIQVFILICQYKFEPKRATSHREHIKEIYKLSIKSMMMLLLMTLNYNIDIIFLNKIGTNYQTGIYSVAVTLANMLWLIPDAFKDVILFKSVKEDSRSSIIKLIMFCSALAGVLVLTFVLIGKSAVLILYGKDFSEVYPVTLLLFAGTFSMILYKIIHPYYIANGKQSVVIKILIVSVISNIALNMLLIPQYGMYGAGVASIVSYNCCGIYFLFIFLFEYLKDKRRNGQ